VVLTIAPVTTERLVLPLWDAATVAAIRDGARLAGWHRDFPREDDVSAASLWHEGDAWAPRSIVRGVTTLGSIGFFGPPQAAADGVPETEVGYGLVAEARGWGFATEALRALLGHTDEAGVRVFASVAPENAASLRVLAKCGFTQLRGPNEDGELVLARPLARPFGRPLGEAGAAGT
jgi:RimJ/RimL family protein N-acetyltransferase